VPTAYNVPTGGVRHPWLNLKIMHLIASYDKTVPLNYGLFETITVQVPKGTVLNPEYPAAVGVRHATAIRINDAVIGALAVAVPGLVPAPSGGTVVPTVIAEQNMETGTRGVMVIQSLVGGTGARPGADGVDGRDSGLANLFNTPLERSEADARIIIENYGLRTDSGGAGKWRGGTGLNMRFRIMADGTAVLGRGLERFVFRPWGLAGGRAGEKCRVILNEGKPGERDLGKIDMFLAEKGDAITILTAGGGGFGDPFERGIDAVLHDVRSGLVSVDGAERDYGVIVADGIADVAATAEIRDNCVSEAAQFGFGRERLAWEQVFDDEIMCLFAQRLLRLPTSIRSAVRARIFETVLPGLSSFTGGDIDRLITDPAGQRRYLQELIDKEMPA
jgi:N-methylhydantoinase B